LGKPGQVVQASLSKSSVTVIGASGQPRNVYWTKALTLDFGDGGRITDLMLNSPETPVNLLGRDLLTTMNATLTFRGVRLTADIPWITGRNTIPEERDLKEVNSALWSSGGNELGRIRSAEPVIIKLKEGCARSRQKQYPMSPEGEEGIGETITDLLGGDMIFPCHSDCNTPILPVVEQEMAVVPDPSTILINIPAVSTYFSVVDLSGAFFSVPLAEESRHLFAFTSTGTQYSYNRLPQGYACSPSIFNRVLQAVLRDLEFPHRSTLVQYCRKDTLYLLTELCNKRHKVSKDKLQLWKEKVLFIGLNISHQEKHLSPERIEAILSTKPKSVKEMVSFLGCAG
uniref:ribonuclease H n=1 Tax=Salmo trutta TaxID=8032 RepID=A0A673YV43_SALTR